MKGILEATYSTCMNLDYIFHPVATSKSIIDVNHLDDVFHQPRRVLLVPLLEHVVHKVALVPLLGWPEVLKDLYFLNEIIGKFARPSS